MYLFICFAYLYIVLLSILRIVCLLGFLHVIRFRNVCCVCFSVLCFRYVYCVLDICFMVQMNVLCFIYVYCDVKHVNLCFR